MSSGALEIPATNATTPPPAEVVSPIWALVIPCPVVVQALTTNTSAIATDGSTNVVVEGSDTRIAVVGADGEPVIAIDIATTGPMFTTASMLAPTTTTPTPIANVPMENKPTNSGALVTIATDVMPPSLAMVASPI